MEGQALWIKDHQMVLQADGRRFLSDANPVDPDNAPPTPEGYFTAALAGILVQRIASALLTYGCSPRGLCVKSRAHYEMAPERVESFSLEVELPEGLSKMQEAVARRVVKDSPFLRIFSHPFPVKVEYRQPLSSETVIS